MSDPVSVLYVLKRYPRLSETFVVREILGLETAGIRVGIDGLSPPEPGLRHPEVDDVRAAVRYVPHRPRLWHPRVAAVHSGLIARAPVVWLRCACLAHREGQWRRFLQAGFVAKRVRLERYRHLHAHFATAAAETARWASELSGVGWTVTAHAKDIFHDDHADQFGRRIATAAAMVTVSEHNVEHIARVAPTKRVRFVPNAVAPAAYHEPRPSGTVLCVARLVAKKGIDTLIDAAAELVVTISDLRVEVIGDGPLRSELEAQIVRLGLQDNVVLRGALRSDDVADAYNKASMLVMPCRVAADGDRDGLPTVILEAMARGLPVVSTDTVGIGEVVRDGETGLLVPADDAGAIANAIEKLWRQPALARTLGESGRALVTHRHDPGRCAKQLASVFDEVTS
ncbi:MAG TPA: glycosyltransferase family 4 protein [Ilumatobacteraceae bacterium]|nr:glycosyltransferase family 4 protein [Ilumatobacteraceae bacterium]